MLGGGRAITFGGGELRAAGAIGRGVTIYAVRRRALAYDSRFIPAVRARTAGRGILYVLLRGWVEWRSPSERHEGPCALWVPKPWVDGSGGARPQTFANAGAPLEVLTVECDGVVPPTASVEVALDSTTWRELGVAHRAMVDSAAVTVGRAASQVVSTLERAAVLPAAARAEGEGPPPALARVWEGVAEAWSRGALPSLDEVAARTRTSTRQVQRDLAALGRELLRQEHAPPWREAMLGFRLKLAVTLLGAPQGTVTEVAERVGYRSSAALARAFRDARIDASPAEVQQELRRLVSQTIS